MWGYDGVEMIACPFRSFTLTAMLGAAAFGRVADNPEVIGGRPSD